jgi:hypothetical protein
MSDDDVARSLARRGTPCPGRWILDSFGKVNPFQGDVFENGPQAIWEHRWPAVPFPIGV